MRKLLAGVVIGATLATGAAEAIDRTTTRHVVEERLTHGDRVVTRLGWGVAEDNVCMDIAPYGRRNAAGYTRLKVVVRIMDPDRCYGWITRDVADIGEPLIVERGER